MSVVLMILLLCGRMTFVLTDKTRAEAVLTESAIRAAGGNRDGTAFAESSRGYFYLPAGKIQVKASKRKVMASVRAGKQAGPLHEKFDAEVCVRVRRPQVWVRRVRAAADAAKAWKSE